MISGFDLGWLVGILEGEGWFGLCGKSVAIRVNMCDEETLTRLCTVLTQITGREYELHELESYNPNASPAWRVQVSGPSARKVLKLVVPHMSWRRRQRIWQTLNGYYRKQVKIDMVKLRSNIAKRAPNVVPMKSVS